MDKNVETTRQLMYFSSSLIGKHHLALECRLAVSCFWVNSNGIIDFTLVLIIFREKVCLCYTSPFWIKRMRLWASYWRTLRMSTILIICGISSVELHCIMLMLAQIHPNSFAHWSTPVVRKPSLIWFVNSYKVQMNSFLRFFTLFLCWTIEREETRRL